MKNSSLFYLACLTFLIHACSPAAQTKQEANTDPAKPNIVYILADDLGYGDLSCYGQTNFSTPNIDRLATNGLQFTQHYSGATVCAPSRSSLMTGLHTGHTFVRGNKGMTDADGNRIEGQYPIPDNLVTLAERLKEVGYVTGAFGKWGLGGPGTEGDPNNQGFDDFYGYNCQSLAHNYYPYHLWDNQEKIMLTGNEGTQKNQYAPDLIQEQRLQFIEENKDTNFFLYMPSVIPHAELITPDSIMALYRGKYGEEKPYKGHENGPRHRNGGYESQAEPHAAFASMVHLLDKQVGEILNKLEDLGLSDNTIVLFTSDNGPHLEGGADPDFFDSNGPLQGYKRDLYEGGIRVPMIASWPTKIKAGQTDHISAFWDVLPTLTELTGAPTPEDIDGISFLPTLTGTGEQLQHDYLYWEFHERQGRQAVRMGKWKGVRYNIFKDPDVRLELYDLSQDIGETNNLAEQHPEIVAQIEEIMQKARVDSEIFPFKLASAMKD